MKVNANLGCVSPHFHAVRVYGTEATFVNGLPDGVLHRPGGSELVDDPYPGVAKGDLIARSSTSILTGTPGRGRPRRTCSRRSRCASRSSGAREIGQPDGIDYVLPSTRMTTHATRRRSRSGGR